MIDFDRMSEIVRRKATSTEYPMVFAAEFDRWLREVRAEAWDEGESDGRWNAEHEAMIERGNREAIVNPYREESQNDE